MGHNTARAQPAHISSRILVPVPLKTAEQLQCSDSTFLISNTDCLLHFVEKDLAISDLSTTGGLHNGVYYGVHQVVRQHHFQLDFW